MKSVKFSSETAYPNKIIHASSSLPGGEKCGKKHHLKAISQIYRWHSLLRNIFVRTNRLNHLAQLHEEVCSTCLDTSPKCIILRSSKKTKVWRLEQWSQLERNVLIFEASIINSWKQLDDCTVRRITMLHVQTCGRNKKSHIEPIEHISLAYGTWHKKITLYTYFSI